ncbi:MAG TPA: hypothetical protein VF722_09220 [Gemmatimonadaceae bacterium]|jgi:phage shock protein A
MMRRVCTLIALLAVVACEKGGFGTAGRATALDSVTTLNTQLANAHAAAAAQDSVMQGFQETTKLLGDIDQELSKVKGLKSHVPLDVKSESSSDPKAAYRASLLGKVQEVTALLNRSRNRVASLGNSNKALQGKISQYEETIASLQAMADRQKQQIAELTGRVDSLTTANTALASAKQAVADTATTLRTELNTVYYVIGTKDDLKKKGIVVEEGSKFLFFGHKALVPARTLDASLFTSIDKLTTSTIMLPSPDRKFTIVSRQDASLVQEGTGPDGKPNGELHITDPLKFWGASKYLIIVEG